MVHARRLSSRLYAHMECPWAVLSSGLTPSFRSHALTLIFAVSARASCAGRGVAYDTAWHVQWAVEKEDEDEDEDEERGLFGGP